MFGFKRKEKLPEIKFDPTTQKAVIRSSICTGEKTVGFKDIKTGKYIDVMYVRNELDIEKFKKTYGIDKVEVDY